MTLSSTVVKKQYDGDDSTVAFPTTFIFWDNADIEVILLDDVTSVETPWVEGTHYTLTGGDGLTGTVTAKTTPTDYTPATGKTLTIRSNLPDTQGSAMPLGGGFPSTTVERALDKDVRLIQQRTEEISRTLKAAKTSTLTDLELPEPEAGSVLVWNGTEDGFSNAAPLAGSVILDEDDMISDSDTQAASQQSIVAWVTSGVITLINKILTSPVFNVGVSGTAIKNEDDMISDSGSHLVYQSNIKAFVEQAGSMNVINNPEFEVAQRGTNFTSATSTVNDDDTYLVDQWVLLSDGNDIVDVSQQEGGGIDGDAKFIRLDVETPSKKFGIFQPIENSEAKKLIGGVASIGVDLRVSDNAKLSDIRAVLVAWDGAADAITSDIVSAWEAEGVIPTLVANWSAENVAVSLGATDSWGRFKIENVNVDTPSAENIGLFIYQNNVATNDTAGVFLEITKVSVSKGAKTPAFSSKKTSEHLVDCQRFYCIIGGTLNSLAFGGYSSGSGYTMHESYSWPVAMRVTPTVVKLGGWALSNILEPAVTGPSKDGISLTANTTAIGGCSWKADSTDDRITATAEL